MDAVCRALRQFLEAAYLQHCQNSNQTQDVILVEKNHKSETFRHIFFQSKHSQQTSSDKLTKSNPLSTMNVEFLRIFRKRSVDVTESAKKNEEP